MGRPSLGKDPYTAKMTREVLRALADYSTSIGISRSDVIEHLTRQHLGLPTIIAPLPPAKPKRAKK